MLKIYLARHGQDLDNIKGILNGHRNEPLSPKGLEQAEEAGVKIKEAGLVFDVVYSSPLLRASVTADIICRVSHNPKAVTLPLLIERDFGIMTGVEQGKIEELCAPDIIKTDKITYFLQPQGAETFTDLLTRAERVLSFVKAKHAQGNILLVTHGDFGKMIYAAYYSLDWKEVLTTFHFGNSELLLLSKDSAASKSHVFKIDQYNN